MRVDWCVSSWFRIKNTHSHTRLPRRHRVGERLAELGGVHGEDRLPRLLGGLGEGKK